MTIPKWVRNWAFYLALPAVIGFVALAIMAPHLCEPEVVNLCIRR